MIKNKENINSLEKFIENIYWGNELTKDKAINQIEKNIIETIYTKQKIFSTQISKGTGLLITSHGYFLTANHVVEKNKNGFIYHNNIKYKIKKICQQNSKEDIALAKAEIPEIPYAIKYKISNLNLLKDYYLWDFPINLKTICNKEIINKYGFLIKKNQTSNLRDNKKITNQLELQLSSIHGESGSPLLGPNGELLGFLTSGNHNFSNATKIFSGIDLIQKEIESLKQYKKHFLHFKLK